MENRKRILIIEDEVIIANHLKKLLTNSGYQALIALELNAAYNYLDQGVDLALVDMNIEHRTSGLEIGNKLKKEYQIPFIYLTANNEPALVLQALETSPASYLTKPFNSIDVLAGIKLALSRVPDGQELLQIKDGSGVIRFKRADVIHAITDGNYVKVVTKNNQHLLRVTMDKLMEILNDDRFYRIHRTALVNLNFVEGYNSTHIKTSYEKLPLARSRKKEFMELMENNSSA